MPQHVRECLGRRPPRTVLIAAALVLAFALAALVYCRGGGSRAMPTTPAESSRRDFGVRMRSSQEATASGEEDSVIRLSDSSDHADDDGGQRQRRVLSNSFFSRMNCRFAALMSKGSDDINTKQFLECCSELSEFFDLFGMSAFRTARTVIDDYIKAINQSYLTSPEDSRTLRELILGKTKSAETSARVALLWLNRGLEFIAKFMTELEVQSSLYSAGWSAYELSLRPYHGFFLRTTFSVALRMAPHRETFLFILAFAGDASSGIASGQKLTADLEKTLFDEIRGDVTALQRCCTAIKDFYKSHNFDSDAVA